MPITTTTPSLSPTSISLSTLSQGFSLYFSYEGCEGTEHLHHRFVQSRRTRRPPGTSTMDGTPNQLCWHVSCVTHIDSVQLQTGFCKNDTYGKRFPSYGGDKDKVEGGQQDISFCYRKDMEIAGGDLVSFVIDEAWIVESGCGAVAWVLESTDGESLHQVSSCHASSAAAMEVRAGLLVLQWAVKEKLERICIKTDCVVFVQGLNDQASAPFCIRTALADFISLCASLRSLDSR